MTINNKAKQSKRRHSKRKNTPALIVAMNQIKPGTWLAYLTSHCVSWGMYRAWLSKDISLEDAHRYTSFTYQGIVPEGYSEFFNDDDPAMKRWILGKHCMVWPSSWRRAPSLPHPNERKRYIKGRR